MPLSPEPAGIGLFRYADPSVWAGYTADSLFVVKEIPSVLLAKDDFFDDSVSAPPSPRVWGLVRGSGKPVGVEVDAFADFPAAAHAQFAIGRLEESRGNTDAALGAYRKLIENWPEESDWVNLAHSRVISLTL
jgi:hypothetical protein